MLRSSFKITGGALARRAAAPTMMSMRHMSISQEEAEARVILVCQGFDKVAEEVKPDSHFAKDLGLDSLDTVELTLAIEEEFGLEIADQDAEDMTSVADAVAYITSSPHAK